MANINKENVSKAEEALVMASKDMIAFGKLFLPDDFMRSETPWFHYEIADSIMDQECKQLAIIMPRGHGKTVLTKCDILHRFCFAREPLFYGWVSATQKLATGNMDYIKTHLEFNEKINYYFGNLKGRKWTEEDVELSNGCKLLSKSNVSGIRGGAKLHKRYDLIVLDDFEDENNTLTPESRTKNANLITAVVYPALEPHTGRLRINGTPVHFDSFINNLLVNHERASKNKEDFSWDVKTYKVIDNKGNVLWDSWFPKKKLEEKKKFYRDSGMPSKFYQEYIDGEKLNCKKLILKTGIELAQLFNTPSIYESADWIHQMVSHPLPKNAPIDIKKRLWEEYRIEIPVFQWSDQRYIRVSCNIYNNTQQMEYLLNVLRSLI